MMRVVFSVSLLTSFIPYSLGADNTQLSEETKNKLSIFSPIIAALCEKIEILRID